MPVDEASAPNANCSEVSRFFTNLNFGGWLVGCQVLFYLHLFLLHIFKTLLQRFLWYVVSAVLIVVVIVVIVTIVIALCETRTIFKGGLCTRENFAFAFMLDRAAPRRFRLSPNCLRARSFQLSFALLPLTCTFAFTLPLPCLNRCCVSAFLYSRLCVRVCVCGLRCSLAKNFYLTLRLL